MGGEVSFGDAAVLVRDVVQPEEAPDLPYIGLEHMEQGSLRLAGWGTASDVASAKFLFQKGDILFGKLRPYFRKVVRAPFDGICSTDIWVVRAKPGFDQGYLFYWMAAQDFVDFASGGAEGTRMPRAKWVYVEQFTRLRLELQEQRAIAHILGTLDDKIELNRRMNETLEAMAQALFKSWFVDFDPVVVNALRAGNPIPEKFAARAAHYRENPNALGLPDEILRLFPARFVDSELGPIPEGWEVNRLPELIEVNPRRSLRKGEVAPYLAMAHMPTRGHIPDRVIERPFGSGTRFMNGDTLVARITPCLENGKTAYVDFLQEGQVGWGSTEYIVLRPKAPLPEEFAYCLARSEAFREFAIQSMTGSSGRQRVPAESLFHYPLISPTEQVANCFGTFVRPLFVRVNAAARESGTLSSLRDTLLPKLISGELRVKDAERFLREVEAA
ncbi:restriction endonuclease subunit S [Deferrisoma sp.]